MQHHSPSSTTPRRPSRSSSFSSETPSVKHTSLVSTIPSARAAPAYVAVAAASQMVSDDQRRRLQGEQSDIERSPSPDDEGALFSDNALALVNGFLDYLLYTFLATARSTSLSTLRQVVEHVLKGKLGRLAIASAAEELEGLLADGDGVEHSSATGPFQEPMKKSEIEMVWKRTRLRIMVYMRLGEMEDEDEDQYVEEEQIGGQSPALGLVPWDTAIFLTAVLEYLAEQSLILAGASAYERLASRRTERQANESSLGSFYEDERVVVEEIDVEKLALNSSLGRLWRTWRKQLRSSRSSRNLQSMRPSSKMASASTARSADYVPSDMSSTEHVSDSQIPADANLTETSFLALAAGTPLPSAADQVFWSAPQHSRRSRSLVNYTSTEDSSAVADVPSAGSTPKSPRPATLSRQRSSSMPSRDKPNLGAAFMTVPSVVPALNSAVPGKVKGSIPALDMPHADEDSKSAPTAGATKETQLMPSHAIGATPDQNSGDTTNNSALSNKAGSGLEAEMQSIQAKPGMSNARRSLARENSHQSGQSGRDDPFTTPAVKDNFKEERIAGTAPQTSASITDFGSTWAQVDSLVLTAKATGEPAPVEKETTIPLPPKSLERRLSPIKSRFNIANPPHSAPAEPHVGPPPKPLTEKPLPDPGFASAVKDPHREDVAGSTQAEVLQQEVTGPTTGPHLTNAHISPVPDTLTKDEDGDNTNIESSSMDRGIVALNRLGQTSNSTPPPQGSRDIPVTESAVATTEHPSNDHSYHTPAPIEQMSVPTATSVTSGRLLPSPNTKSSFPGAPAGMPLDQSPPANSMTSRNGKLRAREARVQTDSTRDFAEFIQSTAPNGDQAVVNMAYPEGRNVASPIRSRNTDIRPVQAAPPRTKRARPAWQPREPIVTRSHNPTSDLIAFLREGPPEPEMDSRTSQSAASELKSGIVSTRGRTSDSIAGRSSANQTSLTPQSSARTSDNSYTGLLTSSVGPRVPQKDPEGRPPSNASGAKQKQYRNKDPYPIDLSDDELEYDRPQGESLIDFLNNNSPPPSPGRSSAPRKASQSRTAVPNGFYVGHGLSSNAVIRQALRPVSPVDEDDQPPAVMKQLFPRDVMPKGNAPQPREPAMGIPSAHSRPSGTSDLADFFKNTQPPGTATNGYSRGYDDLDAAAPPPDVGRGRAMSSTKVRKGFFGRKS